VTKAFCSRQRGAYSDDTAAPAADAVAIMSLSWTVRYISIATIQVFSAEVCWILQISLLYSLRSYAALAGLT